MFCDSALQQGFLGVEKVMLGTLKWTWRWLRHGVLNLSSGQPQQPHRIALQDAGHHFGFEAGHLKIFHPALGGDEWVVAAEQHAVFEQGIGILHELLYSKRRPPPHFMPEPMPLWPVWKIAGSL